MLSSRSCAASRSFLKARKSGTLVNPVVLSSSVVVDECTEFARSANSRTKASASTTTLTSSWHDLVAATEAGSYEERTCSRCFDGRGYDIHRGAWVACKRCSGTARVMVYLYPKLKRGPR